MRILFAGTPAVAVPSLDAVTAAGHDVVAVLTQADAPGKRGRTLIPSPVSQRAADLGLPVHKPERSRDDDFCRAVEDLQPDACVVVAYGQLISSRLLAVAKHGWLNLHFSELPRWRGAAPVQRAIMAGDPTIGVSVFKLVPELDAGPVYVTRNEPLLATDTTDAVLERLASSGAELLVRTLAAIEKGAEPQPQPTQGVTLAPKLTVAECALDFSQPATAVDRVIRGAHSNPGAWTMFRGERFKVNGATPLAEGDLAPGELAATKHQVRVGTGQGSLRLDAVQAFGKKPMSGADWARGAALGPDDRLGS